MLFDSSFYVYANSELLLISSISVTLLETLTSSSIITLLNNNKSISHKDLKFIGIENNKLNEVMALLEKLGIAKSKSK